MKLLANDISMNYELSGNGQYLTLIHGAGDNLNVWYNQVPAFSKHFKVLTYDVRGHGQTELPDGELSMDIWISDLSALLQALGISATILLGHSLGGAIAAEFASTHPDIINALILSSCGGGASRSGKKLREREKRLKAQIEAIKRGDIAAFVEHRITGLFSPGFAERKQDTVEQYKQILLQTNLSGHLRVLQGMLEPVAAPVLTRITCPTLIIEAEYDSYTTPATGKAAQQAIQGSQLKLLPTGHAAALEQPEAYSQTVLQFLSEAGLR